MPVKAMSIFPSPIGISSGKVRVQVSASLLYAMFSVFSTELLIAIEAEPISISRAFITIVDDDSETLTSIVSFPEKAKFCMSGFNSSW